MARNIARAKRSEKGLLTPENCVVAIIYLQPQMLFGVANFDRETIINNNVALLKAAKLFEVPVVLSTVETKNFSGHMWPQIQAIYPNQTSIERTSMNSWTTRTSSSPSKRAARKKSSVRTVDGNLCRSAAPQQSSTRRRFRSYRESPARF